MGDEAKYRKNPDVSWRSIEGQAVLVHNRLGEIMVLNEVGTFIWERFEDGLEPVADAVSAEFSVDRATARQDAEQFYRDLVQAGALVGE
jgi:hypothetical protein